MKKLISAAALAAAFTVYAAPVFAGPGDNPQRRLDYYDNAGTLHEMTLADEAKAKLFMQHAKKLPPGTLLFTNDGQVYILQDSKMSNGQMMSDMLMH